MKRFIFFPLLLMLVLNNPLFALEVFMVTNRYYAPKVGSYVETDILIPATGIKFIKNEKGKYQGFIEVTLLYKKNNEIAAFDKYLLNSMEVDDSNSVKISLVDRKRFTLASGAYTLEATFKDQNSSEQKTVNETFIIDEQPETVFISDIMLIDDYQKTDKENVFTKSGFQMVPYVLNYFPETMNYLTIYAEIYNADVVAAGSQVLVNYSVNKYKTDEVAFNMKRFVKMNANPVNVLFTEFDIEMLPSGNYEISVDVRDKNNQLLAVKKCFFQRSNTIKELTADQFVHLQVENSFVANFTLEEMKYQLRTIGPIVNMNEKKTIKSLITGNNLALMKQFYLNFWFEQNKTEPQKAWAEYQQLVDQANKSYSVNKQYGFETDRGRVFLQYGSPNQVQVVPYEPGAHPYEIWQYYTTKIGQNNVRFIFMNAERATNNYRLIHSTALGEMYNNQWEQLVHGTFTGGNSPTDDNRGGYRDYYGKRSNTIFNE
jgi:GWxTD domain-containing protein